VPSVSPALLYSVTLLRSLTSFVELVPPILMTVLFPHPFPKGLFFLEFPIQRPSFFPVVFLESPLSLRWSLDRIPRPLYDGASFGPPLPNTDSGFVSFLPMFPGKEAGRSLMIKYGTTFAVFSPTLVVNLQLPSNLPHLAPRRSFQLCQVRSRELSHWTIRWNPFFYCLDLWSRLNFTRSAPRILVRVERSLL